MPPLHGLLFHRRLHERLLAGTGWLPEPLRTPGLPDEAAAVPPADGDDEAEGTADGDADAIIALPAFLIDAENPAVPQASAG
jgi:ParB family chromosome partitioning protein